MDQRTAQRIGVGYCAEVLAGLPDPVLVLDRQGKVVYENDAAARYFRKPDVISIIGLRYDDERVFGGKVATIRDTRGAPLPLDPVSLAFATGDPIHDAHMEIDRPRLGRILLSADVIPLHSEMGGLAAVAVRYRDETDDVARRYEGEWLRRELAESRRQVEENLRFAEALNAIGQTIHSTLDVGDVLTRVATETAAALGVDCGVVALREDGSWRIRAEHGLSEDLVGRTFTDADSPNAARAAETRAPIAVAESDEEGGHLNPALATRFGVRASLTVPLLVRDRVTGVLSFLHPSPVHFTQPQIGFVQRVATTAALALENARVYSEERHIADTLQRALLVVPDQIEGIDFEHLYRSATESAWVGGDFFDLFELPGKRVAMVVGDISGKGVEASALASFTRQLLKAHVQVYPSPAEVVRRTSDLLFRVSRTEDFVTLFLAVLDRTDGSLVFCNAGHPAPIVWGASTGSRSLQDGGPLAGAWEGLPYQDHESHLAPGELLVLYTDGLIEAKRDGELFGEERLATLVAELAPRPLEELASELVARVADFANGRLRDDVALLLVSPLPNAGASVS